LGRTNDERSARTRHRLIAAAIECLYQLGYKATVTTEVARRAGVSRGALQHQFESKTDLMIAVARQVVADQAGFYDRELVQMPRDEHFMAITDLTWQTMRQPPAMALIEIMMATRSDSELAARFPDVVRSLQARERTALWRMARDIGIGDPKLVEAMTILHMSAMRGLAILTALGEDPDTIDRAMELLRWYKGGLIERLIGEPRKNELPFGDIA
jgi:AcrR family transcriptional regulator